MTIRRMWTFRRGSGSASGCNEGAGQGLRDAGANCAHSPPAPCAARRCNLDRRRHCERPAFACCASYGGLGVRRSAGARRRKRSNLVPRIEIASSPTRVGPARLAQNILPISGKPEIGGLLAMTQDSIEPLARGARSGVRRSAAPPRVRPIIGRPGSATCLARPRRGWWCGLARRFSSRR